MPEMPVRSRRHLRLPRLTRPALLPAALLLLAAAPPEGPRCDPDNGGIALPPGFCATVFADRLGHVRQLAVAANGDVYANSWSSSYTGMENAPGGFIVALRDADRDGHA